MQNPVRRLARAVLVVMLGVVPAAPALLRAGAAGAATPVHIPLACVATLDGQVVNEFSSSVDLGVTAPATASAGTPAIVTIDFGFDGSIKFAQLAITGALPATRGISVPTSTLSLTPTGPVGSQIQIRLTSASGGPSIPGAIVWCLPTGNTVVASIPIVADPCAQPTIVGSASADDLRGTAGPDVIAGLGGNDVITGRSGDDVLCGGPGDDRLVGGRNSDRVHGGTGIDRCQGEIVLACER